MIESLPGPSSGLQYEPLAEKMYLQVICQNSRLRNIYLGFEEVFSFVLKFSIICYMDIF